MPPPVVYGGPGIVRPRPGMAVWIVLGLVILGLAAALAGLLLR